MKNRKMLAITMISIMSLTSVVPVFARDNSSKHMEFKQIKIEAKQKIETEKARVKEEKETAKAKAKAVRETAQVKEAKRLAALASKLGVDITGLSPKDAQAKIKAAT